jgi:hypothetical protein
MSEHDRELQDPRRDTGELRQVVQRTDHLLKAVQADLKALADERAASSRRLGFTTATAYCLFAALALLGAYSFARAALRGQSDELARARDERSTAAKALDDVREAAKSREEASAEALTAFDQLGSSDAKKRSQGLSFIAGLKAERLSALEVKALKEKASGMRLVAAQDALDSGRQAFARRDLKLAVDDLGRYLGLVEGKPDDQALLLLGQARHGLKEYKEAVGPLQDFLKASPWSRSGDVVHLALAESLAGTGEKAKAIDLARVGADKYAKSPAAPKLRALARRLTQELKESAGDGAPGTADGR